MRELTVPLAGAWDGFVAAVDGVRQLASGSRSPVYFDKAAGDPYRIAAINVMLFATLVFAVVGLRRRAAASPSGVRRVGRRVARAAADLPGHPAAADVAPALRRACCSRSSCGSPS